MRLSFGGDEALGADETNKQQEHCICGNNKIRSAFMICCDYCDRWFHGSCVQVTRVWADQIDKYSCPLCVSLGPSRVTVYKNGTPPVAATPKRGRLKAAATSTPATPTRKSPTRKSPSTRKRTTVGTPTRRTNHRNINFAAEEQKGRSDKSLSGERSPPSVPAELTDTVMISSIASRMTAALLTASRFSISPEKPTTVAATVDVMAMDSCDEPMTAGSSSTLIINYIAQSSSSRVGSAAASVAASVADEEDDDDGKPMDSTLLAPPSLVAERPVKYLEDDEEYEVVPTLVTPIAGTSSPPPMMDVGVLPADCVGGVDPIGVGKHLPEREADDADSHEVVTPAAPISTGSIGKPVTPMSTGSVGSTAEPFELPQRPANDVFMADEQDKSANQPPSAVYSPSDVSSGDDGEEEEDAWSDITPVNRRRRRSSAASTTVNGPDVDVGPSSRAVLTGYFAGFRERNGCAARLNEFLLADDSDTGGGLSDEDTKPHNHSRQHPQRHSMLEKRISRLSCETSPDKRTNIARRQLIHIPETPEEKLRARSATGNGRILADLSAAGNGVHGDNEPADVEVVPQTPIGKIRRESIAGKSRLDTLLKENDAGSLSIGGGGAAETIAAAAAASRKRGRSSHSIVATANTAKRSLFR